MSTVHFKFVQILMIFCGTWRLKFKNTPNIVQKLYNILSYLPQTFFSLFVSTLVIELPFIYNKSVEKLMENLGILILCVLMLLKIYIAQTAGATKLLETLLNVEQEIQSSTIQEDKEIYYKNAKRVTNTAVFLTVYTYLLVGLPLILFSYIQYVEFQKLHPFPNTTDEIPLPYVNWLPFDKNKYYAVALGIDTAGAFYGSTYNVFTQIFFVTLMMFISTRLKILQNHFKSFHLLEAKSEEDVLKILTRIIKEHQSVIE